MWPVKARTFPTLIQYNNLIAINEPVPKQACNTPDTCPRNIKYDLVLTLSQKV